MKNTKIMVFGTFDCLHPGHLNLFEQARKLARNPYLIVSVARDRNVKRIKGKLPRYTDRDRLLLVKSCKLVDKVVLSGLKNHLPHIRKEEPDIIALGYDQTNYTKQLPKVSVVRLKAYKPEIYKTSKLN